MLQRHHHNVMNLEIVGERDDWAVCVFSVTGLVVEYPVADIFDAGLREIIERLEGCVIRDRTIRAAAAREFLDDIDRFDNLCPLVVDLCIGTWS